MGNVTVVGAQWGDEGKGKIVDWLSERADVVVRFQGGHNAGHTLVVGDVTYKLSLLPAGVVRPGKLAIVGNGVVVDPWALLDEIERVRGQGIELDPDRLRIADNACLILPVHGALDRAREAAGGGQRIGTTGRGIGPAYEDKVARRAVRTGDLADIDALGERVEHVLRLHNATLRGFGAEEISAVALLESLRAVAPRILPFVDPVWRTLDEARAAGRRILFEGAQGAMLDVDHGTYPFVTSSSTHAGYAAAGAGVGHGVTGYVLGVAKAYATRVGGGPFPTERSDGIGRILGERGNEFGTVTGRRRRCGWFDAALARQAVKIGGIDGIALTKLDVLDGIETLQLCTGYRRGEAELSHLPASRIGQAALRPVYETLEGWSASTRGARDLAALPAAAIAYVRRIEELVEAPVALLSTGPERDETILLRDPFSA